MSLSPTDSDPDWVEDPDGDDDESSPFGFNDTFESDQDEDET